jgi:hypothetical protein
MNQSESLSGLMEAWKRLDEQLIPLHQHYASERASLARSPISIPRSKPPIIQATAQYSAVLTPLNQSDVNLRPVSIEGHALSESLLPNVKVNDQSMGATNEEAHPYSVGLYPIPSAKSPSQSSALWSRDGFTPKPRVVSPLPTDQSASSQSQPQLLGEKVIERHSMPSGLKRDLSPISENIPQSRHQFMSNELIDASASDAELQAFTSVAERLIQAQERNTGVYTTLDSTQPAPLDELYESINPPLHSMVSRPVSFPDYHPDHDYRSGSYSSLVPLVVNAPKPLTSRHKNSWSKMLIVSLISLMIGGVMAHFFLRDLIQLIEGR